MVRPNRADRADGRNHARRYRGIARADPSSVNGLRFLFAEPEPNRTAGETEPRPEARSRSTACRDGRGGGGRGLLESWKPENLVSCGARSA